MEDVIWQAFGKALLAGGAAYVGMSFALAMRDGEMRLARPRVERSLAAALAAVVTVMVVSSPDDFHGGVLVLNVVLLCCFFTRERCRMRPCGSLDGWSANSCRP